MASCLVDLTMLWHRQLGHNIKKGLRAMHSKGMVEGFPDFSFQFDFYEHCVYGKHNHVRFPTRATRAKEILELVHSYVFGSMSAPSLEGSKYYVSFIDDFSIMTCLYFLKKSSKVFEKFQEYKALVENQIDKKI